MPARPKLLLRRVLLVAVLLLTPLALLSGTASGTATAPADRDAVSQATPAPPGSELHQLDFLLGKATCSLSTGPTLITVTKPILGGTYYQIDMTVDRSAQQKPDTHGHWVLSWSASESSFFSYYYDDTGLHGQSSSPGTQNGQLTFTGPYDFGASVTHQIRDVFTVSSAKHFTVQESLEVNGTYQLLDVQTCVKGRH